MNFEKILIVDDEPSGRRVLEVYLRSQQFSVSTAGTLAEADRLMQQECFDLLLVDLDLPDGDGCEWLQRASNTESRPIALVISGNGNGDCATRCLRAGAFDYIAKPYPLEALTAAMERAAVYRHALLGDGQHGIRAGLGASSQPGNQQLLDAGEVAGLE